MNRREQQIKNELESQGWKILRGGAPDFIALKVTNNGDVDIFKGIEVKSKMDDLAYEQEVYRKLFILAGVPYEVRVV
jgi:Holliday junction resolvase